MNKNFFDYSIKDFIKETIEEISEQRLTNTVNIEVTSKNRGVVYTTVTYIKRGGKSSSQGHSIYRRRNNNLKYDFYAGVAIAYARCRKYVLPKDLICGYQLNLLDLPEGTRFRVQSDKNIYKVCTIVEAYSSDCEPITAVTILNEQDNTYKVVTCYEWDYKTNIKVEIVNN